jgi:hypothetical protein
MRDERKEILLGFDAREAWMDNHPNLHPAHSLSMFTLRDDVRKMLSADTIVWPSLFSQAPFPKVSAKMPHLDTPAWIGANRPFWEELDLLKTTISCGGAEPPPYWLIAATWHTDIGFRRETRQYERFQQSMHGPYDEPTAPPQRDAGWQFLGFDVTDGSFLSGLSDCGYDANERPTLVQQWSPHLNHHHLFDEIGKAFEFRSLSNRRVAEHAPFFVIGLWKISAGLPQGSDI